MVLLYLVMIWLMLSQVTWPQVAINDSWEEICHVNLNFWEFMLPVLVTILLKKTWRCLWYTTIPLVLCTKNFYFQKMANTCSAALWLVIQMIIPNFTL